MIFNYGQCFQRISLPSFDVHWFAVSRTQAFLKASATRLAYICLLLSKQDQYSDPSIVVWYISNCRDGGLCTVCPNLMPRASNHLLQFLISHMSVAIPRRLIRPSKPLPLRFCVTVPSHLTPRSRLNHPMAQPTANSSTLPNGTTSPTLQYADVSPLIPQSNPHLAEQKLNKHQR